MDASGSPVSSFLVSGQEVPDNLSPCYLSKGISSKGVFVHSELLTWPRGGNISGFLVRGKQTPFSVSGGSSFWSVQVCHVLEEENSRITYMWYCAKKEKWVILGKGALLSTTDALCTGQELREDGPHFNVYVGYI